MTQKALKPSLCLLPFSTIFAALFSPSFWFFYAVQLESCMRAGEHPFSTGTMTHSYCALIGTEQGRTIWRAGRGGRGIGGGLKVRKLPECVRASIRFNWARSAKHTHTHTIASQALCRDWVRLCCWVNELHCTACTPISLTHTHRLYVWIVLVHQRYKWLGCTSHWLLYLLYGIWWHIQMKSGETC